MNYFAHSGIQSDHSDWQLLEDHLKEVTKLALAKCADAFPNNTVLKDEIYVSALLHDLGKYRQGFQNYILGIPTHREARYHKQAGALLAFKNKHNISAFVIAGHHGGLPNTQNLKELLIGGSATSGLNESLPKANQFLPEIQSLPTAHNIDDLLMGEIYTRIVFSLLVDADGEDTGNHETKIKGWPIKQVAPILNAEEDLKTLLKNIQTLAQNAEPGPTKTAREIVLNHCLESADLPVGLFSLRVPTGGGKTLSGMAFALKHSLKHNLRRVIYVAPYLTILEQTATVLREFLGKENDWDYVLEQHSLAELDRELDEETFQKGPRGERWDAPIIVTSNVQFWESLFSNKPGKCRKVHMIARSVILLDECQSIPPSLFIPVCSMLKSLASHFGCSIVLCTATQPSWTKRFGFEDGLENLKEIIPPELNLFGLLKRTHVEWPSYEENLSWEEIAKLVRKEKQALVMVNTRKAAKELYQILQDQNENSTFHLSTGLCPEHRRSILKNIKELLAKGEPCTLVATQVLEAGVDIDFPTVFRELAPLEAVIQAAGRCNREGKLNTKDGAPGGKVRVFRSAKGKLPPDEWYRIGISVVETVYLRSGLNPQPDDPKLIEDYFKTLHSQGNLDKFSIKKMREKLNFKDVAEAFQLIKDAGNPIVIASWNGGKKIVKDLLKKAKSPSPSNARRRLAAFQVNLRQWEISQFSDWIKEEIPGMFIYNGPYDDKLGMVADPNSDQLLLI